MGSREPGQVRKEAALSGLPHVPRASLTGAQTRLTRLGAGLEGGCTVHLFRKRPSSLKDRSEKDDLRGMAFDLDAALRETVRLGGSDLHLKVPAVPHARVQGKLMPLAGFEPVRPEDTHFLMDRLLQSRIKREQYEQQGYADLSYYTDDQRYRVAAYSQRGSAAYVFRVITAAPSPKGLDIPKVVLSWAEAQRGLVFVTGPTGSGKSTTSAVLLGLINESRSCHIVTVEDPIEFIHRDGKAIISQREVGVDAPSGLEALRGALRQDADVVMVGEIRDDDTAMTAMRAAETGHVVICTMHTNDAGETVQRFIDLFPSRHHGLARQMLGTTLVGSVSQRLVPGVGGGRQLNTEVLVNSTRIRDMITEGKPASEFHDAIAEGDYYGMQTFDQDLLVHVQGRRVGMEDAIAWATSPHDFKLMLSGNEPHRTQRASAA
jgi:twitching motility protein PilT